MRDTVWFLLCCSFCCKLQLSEDSIEKLVRQTYRDRNSKDKFHLRGFPTHPSPPRVKKFAVVQIFKHREIHLTIQPPRTHPSLTFWDIFSSNLF